MCESNLVHWFGNMQSRAKYIWLYGQVYLAMWTNIFGHIDKYIWPYGQVNLVIWKHTTPHNLHQIILWSFCAESNHTGHPSPCQLRPKTNALNRQNVKVNHVSLVIKPRWISSPSHNVRPKSEVKRGPCEINQVSLALLISCRDPSCLWQNVHF